MFLSGNHFPPKLLCVFSAVIKLSVSAKKKRSDPQLSPVGCVSSFEIANNHHHPSQPRRLSPCWRQLSCRFAPFEVSCDNLALFPSLPLAAARGDVQMVHRFDFVLHCRHWLVYFVLSVLDDWAINFQIHLLLSPMTWMLMIPFLTGPYLIPTSASLKKRAFNTPMSFPPGFHLSS